MPTGFLQHTPAAQVDPISRPRAADASILDDLPKDIPALTRAHAAAARAAEVGFDWPDLASVQAKVDEERGELEMAITAGDEDAVFREYGDLLLATTNLGRLLGLAPEDALLAANQRFEDRFRALELLARKRHQPLQSASLAELDALWEAVKAAEVTPGRRG